MFETGVVTRSVHIWGKGTFEKQLGRFCCASLKRTVVDVD